MIIQKGEIKNEPFEIIKDSNIITELDFSRLEPLKDEPGGSLSKGAHDGAAAGTQTAGLKFGGVDNEVSYNLTEEYNGTAWSADHKISSFNLNNTKWITIL